jgi:ABC-2 type transport system permease protein
MSSVRVAPRAGSADRLEEFLRGTFVVVEAELRKLAHDPAELLARAVQPLLWLVVFGGVFARVRGIPTGTVGHREFLTPGILAQSGLFIAIFYGIAIIWERDLGSCTSTW